MSMREDSCVSIVRACCVLHNLLSYRNELELQYLADNDAWRRVAQDQRVGMNENNRTYDDLEPGQRKAQSKCQESEKLYEELL